jgi:hypothetical protein
MASGKLISTFREFRSCRRRRADAFANSQGGDYTMRGRRVNGLRDANLIYSFNQSIFPPCNIK